MSIQDRLQADLKTAMRSKDKARIDVIRSARAALQNARLEASKARYDALMRDLEARFPDDPAAREAALAETEPGSAAELDEAEQEAVIAREIKRRRDSAAAYQQAGRNDLAEAEENEAAMLAEYLPQQLTEAELRPLLAELIREEGLSGPAAMGKLMPLVMERFKGRAEGRLLSQLARELLGN